MSENLYCPYCVFSDRNFIVPLLHPNVHLIERHPFVYRYRRLPSGYTPYTLSTRPTHTSLILLVSIHTSPIIVSSNERIYTIGIEGSKGIMSVESVYIYIH